jgi:hypothetical protein
VFTHDFLLLVESFLFSLIAVDRVVPSSAVYLGAVTLRGLVLIIVRNRARLSNVDYSPPCKLGYIKTEALSLC